MNGGPRRLLWAIVGAMMIVNAFGIALETANGAGATYRWRQCHLFNRGASGEASASPAAGYTITDKCAQALDDWSYQLKSVGPASGGRAGSITWTAPAGTAIRSFYLDHDSRTADKHYAEIHVLDGNGGDTNIYRAPNAPGGFVRYWRTGLLHRAVRVLLFCSDSGGCVRSDAAHAFVRNVELELADVANPSFYSVSGSLIDGGWKRGMHDFAAQTGDVGSGVRRLDVVINGTPLGLRSGVDCRGQTPPYTAYRRPCGGAGFSINPNTAFGPFRNGVNNVEIVLDDFAGNHRSAPFRVLVDNAPPALAFADSQDPNDPELIKAPVSDQHSGLAAGRIFMRRVGAPDWLPLETRIAPGELRARVDSLSVPAGEYEFRATALDVAGNTVETTARGNGRPMRLAFPLRADAELQANLDGGGSPGQTVPYGTDGAVVGQLLDGRAEPLAGKQVTVIERFGEGALIRERVSEVRTGADGRWESAIPAGPTRRVEASFAGTPRYLPSEAYAGKFTVRSGATFETSSKVVDEGSPVTFTGKVRHFGARVPSGGKLIELQVRLKTGRWETVGEAFRTDERGRYRRSYRFGKHYVEDALFQFRLKVRREANWPFKRKSTGKRKVIVRAG